MQRGLVLISCNGTRLGYGFAGVRPFIKTLLQGARVPEPTELPEIASVTQEGTTIEGCGPNTR